MATDFGFEPRTEGPYLFVSYNTEDAHRIAPIAMCLSQSSIPLWYDRALCAGGETWERQIAEKIESCTGLLMFITKGIFKKAKNSFVHVEYKLAKVFSNKPIYIVLLDKIELNEIPLDLRVWWLDLISNQCIICSGDDTNEEKAAEIIRHLRFFLRDNVLDSGYNRKISLDYAVDIVFCVCVSSSMEPYFETIKKTCIQFPHTLSKEMHNRKKAVSQIRTRLISYQSYVHNNKNAMLVTEFFKLPQDTTQYQETVDSMHLSSSHMYFEESNALEALAYAIRSKWTKTSGRKRQVIILWANEKIAPLGKYSKEEHYPKGMALDLSELREWWYKMDQSGRRLIVFAPNEHSDILFQLSEWDRSIILPITLSTMNDDSFTDISRMICASI